MSLVQSGGVSPRLPSAYQEVEWIGTSGTQYINTGIKATLTSKIELDCQVKTAPSSNAIYYNGTNWFALGYEYENSKYYIDASVSGAGTRYIEVSNSVYLARHTLILDTKNGQWGWDSTLISYTPFGVDDTLNFYIGCRNNGNGFQQACDEYIYEFRYYENEVLQNQLIPCYRKSDNEIGLYDLVNDVFYTNQGSGSFTKGSDIIVS